MSYRDVVSKLNRKIPEVLQPILPHGSVCALLDFPNHANVGDSAIWLGERAYLQSIGASVVYTCDIATYSEDELRARLRGGILLLHGGGNLGDLWPPYQCFREKVIASFPDYQIIQLPQSIHFKERTNLERARAVFNAHPNLTILVRDERSLVFARNEFRVKSALCPDMAFVLGPLDRPQPPTREIIWLSRTDVESIGHSLPSLPQAIDRMDWLKDKRSVLLRVNRLLTRQICHRSCGSPWLSNFLGRIYDPIARRRLLRGCKTLSRGKVVITDRLHGHILSLMMGIPHVILDNNYGKLRSFYETWTKDCDGTVWADEVAEALRHSHTLMQK